MVEEATLADQVLVGLNCCLITSGVHWLFFLPVLTVKYARSCACYSSMLGWNRHWNPLLVTFPQNTHPADPHRSYGLSTRS